TDHGAPESTMPTGAQFLISAKGAVQGSTTEKTFCSRMRRAMSCVYCDPKSRMTTVWVSTLQVWQEAGEHVKNGKVDRIPELFVVIPRLDEFNPVGKYPINDTMFLVNSGSSNRPAHAVAARACRFPGRDRRGSPPSGREPGA